MLICLCCATYLISQKKAAKEQSTVRYELASLEDLYGESLYKALFSLDELRPYSIIQIDRISESYKNDWMSPSETVKKLTEADKSLLLDNISQLIEGSNDPIIKATTVEKIKNWCIDYEQFYFVLNKMGVEEIMLLQAAHKIEPTREVVESFVEKKSPETSYLSSVNKERVIYQTINAISELKKDAQFDYFSRFFGEIALLSK